MSNNFTPEQPVLKQYFLSEKQSYALRLLWERVGWPAKLDAINQFWADRGTEMGFKWTTVMWLDGDAVTFTAEPEGDHDLATGCADDNSPLGRAVEAMMGIAPMFAPAPMSEGEEGPPVLTHTDNRHEILAEFHLTTPDPAFHPDLPVFVNGYEFYPAPHRLGVAE